MGTPRAGRRSGDTVARRTWALLGSTAALIVLGAAVLVVTRPAATVPSSRGSTGAPSSAALRVKVLEAIDASAGDVVSIHRTSSIADGEALNEDLWMSPSQPSVGQQVQRRSVILDAFGSPVQDVEMAYTMPADPTVLTGQSVGTDATGAGASAFRTTGSTLDVDYPSRSWSERDGASMLVALPDDLMAVRSEVATGIWRSGRVSALDGRPAIELTWPETAGITHGLWISADTYLPLREVYVYPDRSPRSQPIGTIESDYLMLPPSAANLAELIPPLPAGFTDESGPRASSGS